MIGINIPENRHDLNYVNGKERHHSNRWDRGQTNGTESEWPYTRSDRNTNRQTQNSLSKQAWDRQSQTSEQTDVNGVWPDRRTGMNRHKQQN